MNSFRKHIRKKLSGYEPEVNDLSLNESWKETQRLLNEKNESRDRLNNFEPDLDEVSIGEKWKAIVPYLPEEKKRRVAFYIPTGCLFPGALLITIILLFSLYPMIDFTTTTKEPEKNSRRDAGANQLLLQKQQDRDHKTVIKAPGSATTGFVVNNFNDRVSGGGASKKAYHRSSSLVAKTPTRYPASEDETVRELVPADNLCFLQPVNCFPDQLVSDSLLKQVPAIRDSVPAKKASHLMVDVTAGMAQLFGKVQFDDLPAMSSHKTGLCLSAALHYQLHKRLLLSTQLIAMDNRYDYQSADTKNVILSRTRSITSTMPSSTDSSITYMTFERVSRLQSVLSCQAGVGIEALLLSRNKFSLSAGLLVQLSMTQFKYLYTYQPGGDTLHYIKNATSPPFPNTAQASEPENRSTTFLKTNLGICPSLVIGYSISNNLDVIIKPAAYIDLKELKPLWVRYKQNAFLLTAGIRLKL